MKDQIFKLTLVTHKQDTPLEQYLDFIAVCAQSGITAVQLREKNLNSDDLFKFAQQLQHRLKQFSIPLIVNDHLELCLKLNAAGIHLGQSDGSILEARQQLGDEKIIGLTVNSLEELRVANTLPIDYVGVGAIFPTQHKADVSTVWEIEGLKQVASLSKHSIVAIGGINESNATAVMQAGAQGIAAIGTFHDSLDPRETTKNLRNITRGFYDA